MFYFYMGFSFFQGINRTMFSMIIKFIIIICIF